MKIDIMRGKGHKKLVIALDEHRFGMKDGYGYDILETFKASEQEVAQLITNESYRRTDAAREAIERVMKSWESVVIVDNPVTIETIKKELLNEI